VAILAAFTAAPRAARAQSVAPSRRPLAESLTGAAKEAFSTAQILVKNGDFAGASTKYEEAYELSKDPRLVYDMAVCARSLRAYARMQSLLVRYEREAGAALSPSERSDVDAALATIRNLVGSVKVVASEDGATVGVDGAVVGTTPLAEALRLDLGEHQLHVEKAGFTPYDQTFQVAGGSESALSASLVAVAHVGHLVVSTDDGSMVFVDQKVTGKGRFEASLPAGPHDVRVTAPGKIAFEAEVDLHDGETRTVQVTLASAKPSAPVWPWIVGGVAVAAGAAIGGYFLFKPSDSGAPISGNFATVQLSSFARSR
jgi:hypothetical protein